MNDPISLYYNENATIIKTLDLCRGDDDFRKVFLVEDGKRKLAIKHLSNTFSNRCRIEGWFRLMEEYRKIGLYCPAVVPNRNGELLHCENVDGRDYYIYAEEFSIYETAEHLDKALWKDSLGRCRFTPDVMRSLGKIASAGLELLDWPSAYCLLEPFCAPDTTDEGTECAIAFVEYIRKNLPAYLERAEGLLALYYQRQEELKAVYHLLPTSCFQGDLNDSNILLDGSGNFVGLIDFNLCGREPILNYAVREALWGVSDKRLFGEKDSRLYFYDKDLDELRINLFLDNIRCIQETYSFTPIEREVFPILFRYMNAFWWFHIDELQLIGDDAQKLGRLFDWLEYQMNRDDIRLP